MTVPANEHIMLINWDNCTCPFCGARLHGEIVGFGRDKCVQYHTCSCATAQAAEAHNTLKEALEKEAYLKVRAEREEKEAKRREQEATKPVVINASEMLCVASGMIIPGVQPIEADDKISFRMMRAGIIGSSAKERLMAYAEKQGFSKGLEKAANEIALYVQQPNLSWDTDISVKIRELCAKHLVPSSITI